MKVENVTNSRSGRAIANQFIVTQDNGDVTFQSYDANIVTRKSNGEILLDETYWNFSNTTGKYRNLFLNEKRDLTEKKIKVGEYKLVNLN